MCGSKFHGWAENLAFRAEKGQFCSLLYYRPVKAVFQAPAIEHYYSFKALLYKTAKDGA